MSSYLLYIMNFELKVRSGAGISRLLNSKKHCKAHFILLNVFGISHYVVALVVNDLLCRVKRVLYTVGKRKLRIIYALACMAYQLCKNINFCFSFKRTVLIKFHQYIMSMFWYSNFHSAKKYLNSPLKKRPTKE